MKTVSLIKRMHATSQRHFMTLFSVATLLLAGTNCFASTITLKWDPVTASDLAGYKVYYSATPTAPFTGTGATQGASPVKLSALNSATITGLDPGRPYYFAITAFNTAGVESPYSSIVTVPELVPPTAAITSPASSATATGTVSVSASASDNVGVSRLEFYVNGVLQATDTAAPYLYSWNTEALSSGVYTLSAKAYDAAGNVGQSSDVAVSVVNDFTAPTVSLSVPTNGASVHGTVPVTATASDNIGVSKVEFYANGALLFAGNVAPYSYSLDTAALANGAYTLSAKAYDAAGNVGNSAGVPVNVLNDSVPPVVAIAAPAANSTLSGTVTVSASASDNTGVTRVDFFLNGVLWTTLSAAPYSISWNTLQSANAAYTLSATAYDALGNSQSASVPVAVFNDTAAPSVAISAPLGNGTVGGTVKVSASASDNVGVTRVEFFLNGALQGTVAGAPYGFSWNTAASPNGTYTLSAKAYDAAGNVGQSQVSVSVFNDYQAPTVAITAPLASSTLGSLGSAALSGTVNVTASASDNVGVTRVEFYLNGILQNSDASAPYGYSWNTLLGANGSYTLSAKAYDAAGNVGQSAVVKVTVFNDSSAPVVNSFSMPAAANSTTVAISSFSATDNVAVTGYQVTESATVPSAAAAGWSQTAQTSFTFSGTGNRTAYAWCKDARGNVSAAQAASVLVDTTLPVIRSMSISGGSATVTIKASATDNSAIGKLQLYIDGTLRLETAASSFNFAWAVEYQGIHKIVVKAFDTAGNSRSQALSINK